MYRRYGGRRSTQDRKNFSDFGLDSAMARPSSFDGPSMPPWRTISSSREDASLTTCAGLQALSPPTMWAKDCTAQGRFCLTVECACATNLRRSTQPEAEDRKSTRLNSSHVSISYAVFCLKKKKKHKKNN